MKGPTVKQLQAMLRARGLPVSGRKAALVERLASAGVAPEVSQDTTEPPTTRRPPSSSATVIPADATPRSNRVAENRLRVVTWNVAGLRGLLRREEGVASLRRLVASEEADVLLLQETKLQEQHVPTVEADLLSVLDGAGGGHWRAAWACSVARKGYSGVATLWCDRQLGKSLSARPLEIDPEHEAGSEGRTLLVELPLPPSHPGSAVPRTPGLALVNVYTPNAGADLQRLSYRVEKEGWDDKFRRAILATLESPAPTSGTAAAVRHLCVGGDLNVAVEDRDFFNPGEQRMARQVCCTPLGTRGCACSEAPFACVKHAWAGRWQDSSSARAVAGIP